MKKLFLSCVVMFGMAITASAQLIVGGNLGFGGRVYKNSENSDVESKSQYFNFNIDPKVGYIIDEKIEVGAALSFVVSDSWDYSIFRDANGKNPKAVKTEHHPDFSWAINPYARYRCFEVNGFGFWLEGVVSLGTSILSRDKYLAYKQYDHERTSEEAKEMNKLPEGYSYSKFNGSFYVQPVLTYDINDNWRIESQIGLLSLGFGGYAQTSKYNADKETTNYFSYELGVLKGKAISLGVVYKF